MSEKKEQEPTLSMCFHFGGLDEARVWISQSQASLGISINGKVIFKTVKQWYELALDDQA